jgi:hypothetical protein
MAIIIILAMMIPMLIYNMQKTESFEVEGNVPLMPPFEPHQENTNNTMSAIDNMYGDNLYGYDFSHENIGKKKYEGMVDSRMRRGNNTRRLRYETAATSTSKGISPVYRQIMESEKMDIPWWTDE